MLAGLLFVCLFFVVQIIYWFDPFVFKNIIFTQEALFNFIDNHFIIASGLYIIFFIITVIFGIPFSITAVGGYLFGIIWGTITSMIGALLGVVILCNVVRFVLRDWFKRHYGAKLKPFNKQLKRYGILYIMIIQMVPFMPSFLPNAASSISSLSIIEIVIANGIGGLPPTMVYSYIGAYIHQVDSFASLVWLIAIISGLVAISVLSLLVYRFYIRQD